MPTLRERVARKLRKEPRRRHPYDKLKSDSSFRILELLPGKNDESIAIILHVADWKTPPKYEAISYAWGDTKVTVPLICQGHVLKVTPSLYSGLLHFRRQDRSRFLWADAICIDQSNAQERGHQVSNMKKVYDMAAQVLVWLGPDDAGKAKLAMESIDQIIELISKKNGRSAQEFATFQEFLNARLDVVIALECLPSPWETAWQCLAWLYSRPWFRRLWVLQEVYAKEHVRVTCGPYERALDVIAIAAEAIVVSRKQYALRRESMGLYVWNAAIMLNRAWINDTHPLSTLDATKDFDSSDTRDRVYGILGIIAASPQLSNLEVDYSKTPTQVFADVAITHIKSTNSLEVLSYTLHVFTIEEPSWIPNWGKSETINVICNPLLRWDASKSTQPSIETHASNHILTVSGIALDSVADFEVIDSTQLFPYYLIDLEISSVDPRYWPNRLRGTKRYSSFLDIITAYAMAFSIGQSINERSHGVHRAKEATHRCDFAAYLIDFFDVNHPSYPTLKKLAESGNGRLYRNAASTVTFHRSIFTTNTGHIGLGPSVLQPQDIICVLYGGKVPYILRPAGDHYLFVGEAYVHGYMEGEAISQWRAGELGGIKEQVFEIH